MSLIVGGASFSESLEAGVGLAARRAVGFFAVEENEAVQISESAENIHRFTSGGSDSLA